jgi:hypothetical protein
MLQKILVAIIIIILILILYHFYEYSLYNTKWLRAKDGEYYKVHFAHDSTKEAVNTLSEIHNRIVIMFKYIIATNPDVDKRLEDPRPIDMNDPTLTESLARMIRLYNVDNIIENSPFNSQGETSYVEDKGKVFAICLRNKGLSLKESDIMDMNTIMFVILHEMTHYAYYDWEHPLGFWKMFVYLIKQAKQAKVYMPINYQKHPIKYCTLLIDYSPYYDKTLNLDIEEIK